MVHPLFYYTCEIRPKFEMTQKKNTDAISFCAKIWEIPIDTVPLQKRKPL